MSHAIRSLTARSRYKRAVVFDGIRRLSTSSSRDSDQYRGFLKEFTDGFKTSVKDQYEKNKEFYEGVGLLSDGANGLSNSAVAKGLKKAADVSFRTRSKIAEKVSDAADDVLESEVIQNMGSAVGSAKEKIGKITKKVSQPISDNKTIKVIGSGIKYIKEEVIDTTLTDRHYEGVSEKDRRETEWEELMRAKLKRSELRSRQERQEWDATEETNIKDITLKTPEGWEKYFSALDTSKFVPRTVKFILSGTLNSCGKVKAGIDSIMEKLSMEESEEAKVIKAIKEIDSEFEINTFISHANNYIIPSILEAFLDKDLHVLSMWSDIALFARLKYLFNSQKSEEGNVRTGKLLDLRDMSVYSLSLIDGKIPMIIITFSTNEVYTTSRKIRNKNKLCTDIESAFYSLRFTKARALYPEAEFNIKTDGWIVLDFNRTLR